MPDNRDELDRLVDSALATYADPGPESGLEERILRRVAAEAAPAPRRRWLAWAVALPVAAGLAVFAVVSTTRQVHGPAVHSTHTRNPGQASPGTPGEVGGNHRSPSGDSGERASGPKGPSNLGSFSVRINPCPFKTTSGPSKIAGCTGPTNRSSLNAKRRQGRAVLATKSAPLPKLEIFPTPQPLSPEEQTLVNFAAHATKTEREAFIAAQREADAPLSIAAIEIRPLEPPASGAN